MDPKTLASLDPKLRETYERVMGTTPGTTPTDTTNQNTVISPNDQTNNPPNQLPTTNPFATPPSEAVDTNPNTPEQPSDNNQNLTAPDTSIPTLNPDGLSSAFPTAPIDDQPDNQSLPAIGANTVDMSSFNLNPMGQKTDQVSMPTEESPQAVNPVVPFTPQELPPTPIAPTQSSFTTLNIKQAKPVSPTIRIIYIFAATIFFLIYTLFWLKIFKFPLPF